MKKLLLSLLIVPLTAVNAQWVEQNTAFTEDSRGISHISIADASTVWAQAYDGSGAGADIFEFTKTTDAGTTWTPGTISLGDPSLSLTDISAVNGTTAWVGGFSEEDGQGGAYKTTDGGVTWTLMTPGKYVSATSWFNTVHFFDAQNGILMGDCPTAAAAARFEVYYTSNGGTTWTAPPSFGTNAMPSANQEYSYTDMKAAAGGSFWFGTSGGRIFRTTNMGVNWTVHTTPIEDFNASTMFFNDANNGVIISGGMLYKTTDGGVTWSTGEPYTGLPNVSSVPGTMALVSTSAALATSGSAYSPDMGSTWIPIDAGVQHTAVAFLNATTGWTGGFSGNGGGISKFDGNLRASTPDAVKVSVTPNPTNGTITITGTAVSSVSVFDLTGKKVYQNDFANVENAVVDLSGLQSGAYFLQAKAENGAVQTVKVLKQ